MTKNIANDEERGLDELIALIGDKIEAEDQRAQIMNFPRVKQLEFTYKALKILLAGQDVSISYKLNEPFKSMGSVSVEGKTVEFFSTEWFQRAATLADNIDIYPLTNGKLRITFTFYKLTKAL